jgi:hypothetical protein
VQESDVLGNGCVEGEGEGDMKRVENNGPGPPE